MCIYISRERERDCTRLNIRWPDRHGSAPRAGRAGRPRHSYVCYDYHY